MSKAPSNRNRSIRAYSLSGLYSVVTTLPSVLLLWAANMSLFPTAVVAQTDSSSEAQRNTRDQLEEARQRLIEQGEGNRGNLDQGQPNRVPLRDNSEFDSYRLGPGDSFFVNVLYFPDLNFQTTLDLQGNVIVPLAGLVSLNGLTIQQAEQRIQSALNQYVINPVVDMTLTAQRPVEVTIAGEVVRPGIYPLQAPQLNVALLAAGGTTRLADLRTIRIRRTLVDGSVIERDVDFYTSLRDSTPVPSVRLENGDAIIVPALNAETIDSYDPTLVGRSTIAQQEIVVRVLNYAARNTGRGEGGAAIGNITLTNGSTFLDAITAIGPSPDRAELDDIALIRFDPIQGKAVTQELDAKDALLGDASQNPFLEHNDVIVIGRNFIARISYALNTATQPFRDILGFLLFFDNLAESADDLFGPGDNDDDDDDD
ncbi:polysaccharide biosynthesis/export family protein [Oscillatoria sp. FACHB-1407]|uniref:polysaccharide biosynthesis/export family protein n=1 Tax=Oscillatoria sp. FACHB-1407 TaxID=2692847 RepID=UPI001688E63F|nr:polysaccharide biosynthesis/export family protein [Oscillatoria sp. FACHB-1407]MBD2462393.1 polysaccharide biosynthesis/export family protein [Oscillatoria sp. FACHB-1407]